MVLLGASACIGPGGDTSARESSPERASMYANGVSVVNDPAAGGGGRTAIDAGTRFDAGPRKVDAALDTGATADTGVVPEDIGMDAALDTGLPPEPDAGPRPDIAIAKWFGNKTAAISLNLDGDPQGTPGVLELVAEHRLAFDLELVTGTLNETRIAYIQQVLIPRGITFFGHGQTHVNHDALSAEAAQQSAELCFARMQELGLAPVSFAYPGGHGREAETQRAIAAAGFLSARDHNPTKNPYIVPDDARTPRNWFLLPDVVMESFDYRMSTRGVDHTDELIPFLDGAIARTAWIILTYHAIGRTDQFGFYYLSDFANDLDAIAARDFWSASMDAATLYVRERENASATITRKHAQGELREISVYLEDGLPNERFVQPLTLLFELPETWVGVPLMIQDDTRRWPDQIATDGYAALSLPPFEREFRIAPATSPYEPEQPPPAEEEDADAGI